MNLAMGNGGLGTVFASSKYGELVGFGHRKKFLDPRFSNFSSAFKPATIQIC